MVIYVMDRDFDTLKNYESSLNTIKPSASISYFTSGKQLLDKAKEKQPDLVIMEAESSNAINNATKIRTLSGKSKIILTAKTDAFALEATEIPVSSYMLKPVTEENLKKTISKL